MSTNLATSARAFVHRYQADEGLKADHRDWNCTLSLQANDDPQRVGIVIVAGEVQSLLVGAGAADLVVSAPLATLVEILELRLNPNQPYLFGELTLQGEEADFMRVDYIASTLCAHA
ncbi:MAG: SCP2 sterol-binding domain-containing protein [Usitatibacter sp.]